MSKSPDPSRTLKSDKIFALFWNRPWRCQEPIKFHVLLSNVFMLKAVAVTACPEAEHDQTGRMSNVTDFIADIEGSGFTGRVHSKRRDLSTPPQSTTPQKTRIISLSTSTQVSDVQSRVKWRTRSLNTTRSAMSYVHNILSIYFAIISPCEGRKWFIFCGCVVRTTQNGLHFHVLYFL